MCLQLLLQTNLPVPPGAEIRIKNLKGVTSPRHVEVEVVDGMAIPNAVWNVASQYLIIPVPSHLSLVEPTRIRFVLRNPASAQVAPSISVEITGWHRTQVISSPTTGSGNIAYCACRNVSCSLLRYSDAALPPQLSVCVPHPTLETLAPRSATEQ